MKRASNFGGTTPSDQNKTITEESDSSVFALCEPHNTVRIWFSKLGGHAIRPKAIVIDIGSVAL